MLRDLAPHRLKRLRELLRESHVLRVGQLCRRLGVSVATVRRDLETLAGRGEIERVHGGAVSLEGLQEERPFEDKASIASREKVRIAEAALRFVRPGETIYLDGGSTVLELARRLRRRTHLTVVTNSLRAAQELGEPGPRLLLLGGELRPLSQTLVGPFTRLLLEELHLDRAFMGTLGFTLEAGPTTTDLNEAYTKALVMERAREVILLADSGKLGKLSTFRAGRADRVCRLITDTGAKRSFVSALRKQGVEVICA